VATHSETRKRAVSGTKELDKSRVRKGRNVWDQPSTNTNCKEHWKKLGYCAARRKDKDENGGVLYCMKKAGWGTDHPGIGSCRYHGGDSPQHRAGIERRKQILFMGRPKDISALDAIVWAITITAGEVEFLSSQIAEINDKKDWIELTIQGKQLHVFQRARADAMDRLVRYSKDAISLGLAERTVRMAEQFGATIARLLEGIQKDLDLSPSQRSVWPVVVRKHLIMLEGTPVAELEEHNGKR
jgi:hypothetical protein